MKFFRNFFIYFIFLFFVLLISPTDASAADRYWVGGTANWDTSTARWSSTSGGASGASVPTATDNCFFDSASGAVTVTINTATRTCLNANFTGFTGTLAGTQTWNISGGLTLGAGMTVTYTGTITFNATSGTHTITSNGKALLSPVTFNGSGGTWQLADTFTTSGSPLTLTAGTFDGNSQTVVLNGTTQNVTGAFTFANLTRTGAAAASSMLLANNITVTGTLTLNGNNSSANRMILRSSSRGVPRTVDAGSVSASNLDIEDITAAGAADWNLSAITGLSGDGGGNTGITFTSAGTSYWVGNGGNFSDSSHWASSSGGAGGSGRIPLLQDTARFDENSFTASGQTVTYDMVNIGSTDWTGVTNAPTWTNSVSVFQFGSFTHSAGMSITGNTFSINFVGHGSYNVTNAGVEWPTDKIVGFLGTGTYTLMDDISGGWLRMRAGTFVANGHNLTIRAGGASQQLVTSATGTLPRTINMGSGTWTFANIGTFWNSNPFDGLLTIVPGTATIKVTGTGIQSIQLDGGQTYPNFWNATAGETTRFTFAGGTGSTTWNNIKIDPGNTHLFNAGTTTTVSSMTITGTSGSPITIGSITAAAHDLVKTGGGVVSGDYLSISNSHASPANTFYAGTHSFDGGGNTGWIFTDPPVVETQTGNSSGSRPRSINVSKTTPDLGTSTNVVPDTGLVSQPSNVLTNGGTSECLILSNVLKQGFRGPGVACLQKKLNLLLPATLVADGIFGEMTKQAVIDFQIKNGLVGDGIVGPMTKVKMQ